MHNHVLNDYLYCTGGSIYIACILGRRVHAYPDIQPYTPSGAVKEVILRVTECAQKEVIARVGLGFGRCCP
jgi:hypothetical protein